MNEFWRGAFIAAFILSALSYCVPAAAQPWHETVQIPPGDKYGDALTDDLTEIECLALNVYHEARGEGLLGMELVAQVTMNRVRHPGFLNTVCEVIRRPYQFEWIADGLPDGAHDRDAWAQSYLVAIQYLYTDITAPVEGADRFLNYHSVTVAPEWRYVRRVFQYRRHIFYVRCAC